MSSPTAKTQLSESDPLSGVLVLDKPLGITSMTAVAMVRRAAGGVRTGHAGTLDPLACGVLVLALGACTRLIDRLMATDKRYRTTIDLAAFTSTDDREGERTEVAVAQPPSDSAIRAAAAGFVGEILQAPPAFSAVKIDGKRAYKSARKGQAVQIAPRPVRVHGLQVIEYRWPLVELAIHCGKGFYVRSLARDLGRTLGTGGHCAAIRRTAVGPFSLELARTVESLPARIDQSHLLSAAQAMQMVGDSSA